MNYYFAPMEGITGAVFRRTHHEFFPGIDKYFMPFITPTTQEKLTPRQKRDVLPEYNEGVPAVPQLLTRTAADFIWAANTLASLGYAEVNLNLGCPSGTVTAKGRPAFSPIPTSSTAFWMPFSPPARFRSPSRHGLAYTIRRNLRRCSRFTAAILLRS